MKKLFIILGALLLIAAIVFLNIRQKKEKPVAVTTEKVALRTVEERVSASGRVQPVVQVNISANVAGEIKHIYVKEGEYVDAGQLLIQLDKVRYEADVQSARASYNSRLASLNKAQKDKERTEALYNSHNISLADLESIQSEYQLALSQVEQSKAILDQASDNLSKTTILAPIPGTIIRISKEEGEIALGSQFQADIIMVLADLSKMEVEVDVNENDVVRVSQNDPVDIEIDAIRDTTFRGIVDEIAHLANSSGLGTQEAVTYFTVVVKMLEIPESMRPGMSATVEILTDRVENTVAVPIQAVTVRTEDKMKSYENLTLKDTDKNSLDSAPPKAKPELLEIVFKADGDTARAIPVKIGLSSDEYFQIVSGIQEGDEIITGNHKAVSRDLQDGMLIEKNKVEKKKKAEK